MGDSRTPNQSIRYVSLCSGIEAASVAWKPLGWQPLAFAEIDPFCCALLRHYYPEVPNFGDITELSGKDIISSVGRPDVLVAGTPCQSFSVAGKRLGLSDPRGNITIHFLRLTGEIRPEWIVWENVPGVLSIDGGETFRQILSALDEFGYGLGWRVLDAQYFGVPQRRRRVFLVGRLGDWRGPAEVLFEPESVRRHSAPRREAAEETATPTGICAEIGPSGGRFTEIAPTVATACTSHGVRLSFDNETFVAHTLRGRSFSAGEDGAGKGVPVLAVCVQEGQSGAREYKVVGTVRSDAPGSQTGGSIIRHDMAVRRMTPRECERLQGFPDDYTLIPYRGGMAADGPRYRSIGNSMAVPVMRWIGERIQMVNDLYKQPANGKHNDGGVAR